MAILAGIRTNKGILRAQEENLNRISCSFEVLSFLGSDFHDMHILPQNSMMIPNTTFQILRKDFGYFISGHDINFGDFGYAKYKGITVKLFESANYSYDISKDLFDEIRSHFHPLEYLNKDIWIYFDLLE